MTSLLRAFDINNRDLSIAIWLAMLIVWASSKKPIRQSLLHVAKAMTARVIIISLGAVVTYVALLVYILYAFRVWEIGNLKDSVLWFFGSAFVMFVHINRAGEDRYFLEAVVDNLKLAAIIGFVLNLYVFSIWIELVLVPFLFILAGLIGVASSNSKHQEVEKLLTNVLALVGIVFLMFAVIGIAQDSRGFLSLDNLRDFLIPLLLSVGFLPFIYALGLYVLYDSIFSRMELFSSSPEIALHAKFSTFRAFNFNLSAVRSWSRGMGRLDLKAKSDIVEALKEFRSRGA